MSPEETSDLLKTFAATRCEAAFRALVAAYAGPVHATALRVARGDAETARDAVQNVFAKLARKPRAVRDGAALGAWLHRCATHQVMNMRRADRRRRAREAGALSSMMNGNDAEPPGAPPGIPPGVAGEIDLALDRLGHTDRRILTLRFWLEESWSGIAAALSLTEDAAQKRAGRALEKMRRGLTRRGVTGVGTAAGLAAALSLTSTSKVSAAVVTGITAHALSASLAPAAGAGAAGWGLKTLYLAMNTKAKLTLCAAVCLLTAAGFGTGYTAGQSSARTVSIAGGSRLSDSPSPPSVRKALPSAGPAGTSAPAAKAAAGEPTPPEELATLPRGMADALARDCLFGGPNSRPGHLSLAASTMMGLDAKTVAELNQSLADLTKRSLALQRKHTRMVKNTPEEQVFVTGSFHGEGGSELETEMRAAFAARLGEERAAKLLKSFPRPASEESVHLGFGERTLTFRQTPEGYNVRVDWRAGPEEDGLGNSVEWNSEGFPDEFRGLVEEEKEEATSAQ